MSARDRDDAPPAIRRRPPDHRPTPPAPDSPFAAGHARFDADADAGGDAAKGEPDAPTPPPHLGEPNPAAPPAAPPRGGDARPAHPAPPHTPGQAPARPRSPDAPLARRRPDPAAPAAPAPALPQTAADALVPLAEAPGPAEIHATAVAAEGPDGRPLALLLLGPSGAGKSETALALIALGARLVADDRVRLAAPADGGPLVAAPVPPLEGLVEARGLGLLRQPHLPDAPILAACDLSATEPRRLPPRRAIRLLRRDLPLILAREVPVPALLAFLRAGGRRQTA